MKLHHLALKVRDVASIAEFYRRWFALQTERVWHNPDGSLRSEWLLCDNGMRLMVERADDGASSTNRDTGWFLAAFSCTQEERKAFRKQWIDDGMSIEHETDHTMYVRDPEGHRVALSSWPPPAPHLD